MATNAGPEQVVGSQFLEAYYNAFRTNRASLRDFYNAASTLSWEKRKYVGQAEIATCFDRISAVQLDYVHIDSEIQVTHGGGLLILVTGHVRIDGAEPVGFSQVFLLQQTEQQSWYSKRSIYTHWKWRLLCTTGMYNQFQFSFQFTMRCSSLPLPANDAFVWESNRTYSSTKIFALKCRILCRTERRS